MSMRSVRDSFVFLCAALVFVCCGENDGNPFAPDTLPTDPPVVREILGQTLNPPGAKGQRLTLVRYTIAPGAELVPHLHPGIQMAFIESGTLTYRVISGTAMVQRQVAASGIPASVESFVGPAETALRPGDTILEEESMVHFGSNRTSQPVVILATLITDPSLDLAVPVPTDD